MTTSEILRIIALMSAYSRADEQAVGILLDGADRANLVRHLIEFSLMVMQSNTEGQELAYLEFLASQARTIQASEARQ